MTWDVGSETLSSLPAKFPEIFSLDIETMAFPIATLFCRLLLMDDHSSTQWLMQLPKVRESGSKLYILVILPAQPKPLPRVLIASEPTAI